MPFTLTKAKFIVGVLFDYFRAPDANTAKQALELPAGPLLPAPAFDGVEAKAVDPTVILGQLIAFIRRTPLEPNVVGATLVCPPPENAPATEEAYNELPEGSPWKEGPWLQELAPEVRDALATVDDGQLSNLAAQWVQIEEFPHGLDVKVIRLLIQELVGLARRARDSGDQLYCWSSL
jgi:hypothetical protein